MEELEEGNDGAMKALSALDERSEEVRLSAADLGWFFFDVAVAVGGGDASDGDTVVAGVFDSFVDVSWMWLQTMVKPCNRSCWFFNRVGVIVDKMRRMSATWVDVGSCACCSAKAFSKESLACGASPILR